MTSPRYTRADMVLMRRAERQGWGVPEELKVDALTQAARIMATGNTRERLSAIKLLVAMDRVDQMAKVSETELPDSVRALREFLDESVA